jgi:hypothetical protein
MQVLAIASYSVPLDEIVADLEAMDIKVLDTLDKIAGLVVELREDQPIDLLYKVHGIISFEEDRPVKSYETV